MNLQWREVGAQQKRGECSLHCVKLEQLEGPPGERSIEIVDGLLPRGSHGAQLFMAVGSSTQACSFFHK